MGEIVYFRSQILKHECWAILDHIYALELLPIKQYYRALSWIHTQTQAFFYRFVACTFPFFEVKSVLPIDRYQNATSKAISLHELKKVQLQKRYTLVTQGSIGHLKTLCMSVLSLVVALESEWKSFSSSQSDKKKTLAFDYEFSFRPYKYLRIGQYWYNKKYSSFAWYWNIPGFGIKGELHP